jgi:hypothetical protein
MRIRIPDRGPRSNADQTGSESETLDQDIKFVCEGQTPFYGSESQLICQSEFGTMKRRNENLKEKNSDPKPAGWKAFGKAYSTPNNWTV